VHFANVLKQQIEIIAEKGTLRMASDLYRLPGGQVGVNLLQQGGQVDLLGANLLGILAL
jgi:hypothetical protein